MAQKTTTQQGDLFPRTDAPPSLTLRRRRPLILPRYLRKEADCLRQQGANLDEAHQVLIRWADLETSGALERKETALDADFLNEVFGEALGYRLPTHSPQDYHVERQFTVAGVGSADGALGNFSQGESKNPIALIELKPAGTDLDRDKLAGRTPVQQCWDYLNAIPECPWGIVSNFITIRLYHRDKSPQRFEHFTLQELRNLTRFHEFFALLSRPALLPSRLMRVPPTLRLLEATDNRQREVGDELYETYSQRRLALIDHLHRRHEKSVESAVGVAQKIMDRIIFVAFCEDRALLPDRIIERTYNELPPFAKVTNPRWRNFLDLFRAVDRGHRNLNLEVGYDGGLFRHDSEVDDLQLEDDWTDFFREVSRYDFRDEVNVDVLGHLFEKSVTELEKIRSGGLLDAAVPATEIVGKMPKSARRKRFGIYYTPADFTEYIVRRTVGDVVRERFAPLAEEHGVDRDKPELTSDRETLAAFSRGCIEALRTITICDPACGSGAFLIQAYDFLEQHYSQLIDNIALVDVDESNDLSRDVPDAILSGNLFGVDVSPEAVEITQLALWIRSARRGRTLADLSGNIVCGDSLVVDKAVSERAMRWSETFPTVFRRPQPGFDCVVSNPPWERMKLQEREFFSFSAPKIAEAVSAAKRRKLIAALEKKDPALFARYQRAKQKAEAMLAHVRASGEFPLTAKGDINTYALFAELARKIVAPAGRVGLLVPSGIASDNTTKDFFAAVMGSKSLLRLFDFENRQRVFPDVDGRFKFSILGFGGESVRAPVSDFVFFAHHITDLEEPGRHVAISAEDIALFNPNTRTCPIFRSRRDAELTKAIYRRVPILVDELRGARGNPWGIRFFRMFDQTNDAEKFHTAEQLQGKRFRLDGNVWIKGKKRFLPLYEAKMIQAYDHRAAGVVVDTKNWMRQGQTLETPLVSHQNTDFRVLPRWWVDEAEVIDSCGGARPPAFLSYKDVTSPTNERTMIAAFIPFVGVVNSAPLVFCDGGISERRVACLLANLNSFVLDFVARQKVGNVHLNFFIVKQFPCLFPDAYDDRCPWDSGRTLERWISDRVLKLTCTAADMVPLAEACNMKPPVHKWKPQERAELRAELDAAYFLLYGVEREDVEYILSTFTGVRRRDMADGGDFRTAKLILEAYDKLFERMG